MSASSPTPLISIITPTYNRPDFLARALLTLTDQTCRDFEVVVVNDAGVGVEPVLERFAGKLDITYVRHGRNRDRAAARNTGLGIARGRFIAYLDDDDLYRADHLETLVAPLLAGTHHVSCSDSTLMLEIKTPTGYQPVKVLTTRSTPFDRERLLIANYIPILSLMHSRTCLDDVGRFDESLRTHEDWDLFIRLSRRYEFFHVPKITADVSYREDGSSTTSADGDDFGRTMALIHARYRGLVQDRPEMLARQKEALARMFGVVTPPAEPASGDPMPSPPAPRASSGS